MTTPSPIHPFHSRPRLNKPPLANRAKLYIPEIPMYDPNGPLFQNRMESRSSNASCDTTLDETASLSSRDHYSISSFNLSYYLEPVADSSDVKSTNTISMENQENIEDHTVLNSTLYHRKKTPVDGTKYKTEMCKKWSENGQCPYGTKCRFAHGKNELNDRFLPNRSSYKSKKCNSFHMSTICPYGTRCLFAHEQRSLEELVKENYYTKFISCPDFLNNPVTKNKKRLPIFSLIVKNEQRQASPIQGCEAQSWKSLISKEDYEEFRDCSVVFGASKFEELLNAAL